MLNHDQSWVNVNDATRDEPAAVHAARVSRVRATYTLTSRMFVRGTVQYVATNREPELYASSTIAKSGTVSGQVLLLLQVELAIGPVRRLRRRSDALDRRPLREGRSPVLRQALLRHPALVEDTIMTTHHIGRIVVGCLVAGLVVAPGLIVGPLADAREHVITGTVLLTLCGELGRCWRRCRRVWANQPQRWAAMPAVFMGVAGAGVAGLRAQRRRARRARVDLAASLPGPSRGDRHGRAPATCVAAAGSGSSTR